MRRKDTMRKVANGLDWGQCNGRSEPPLPSCTPPDLPDADRRGDVVASRRRLAWVPPGKAKSWEQRIGTLDRTKL